MLRADLSIESVHIHSVQSAFTCISANITCILKAHTTLHVTFQLGPGTGAMLHNASHLITGYSSTLYIINPRRACAARVTVVGSVCPLSHISPMERLFVLKTLSRTQRATKVKIFVGCSLKPLRCRDPAPPPLYG